jgi:hypothetical protein
MISCATNLPQDRSKKPVDPVNHVSVLDKLAAVGLLDAALHFCDEPSLVFEHTTNPILNQLLHILAVRKGHLLKPCFHIWSEMYFHDLQASDFIRRWQQLAAAERANYELF